MFKLTRKQRQEIDFFSRHYRQFEPTEQEIAEYIAYTALGKGSLAGKADANRLMQAKTDWDRTVKMWREDIPKRQLFVRELLEDPQFSHLWAQRAIRTMAKRLGIMAWLDAH